MVEDNLIKLVIVLKLFAIIWVKYCFFNSNIIGKSSSCKRLIKLPTRQMCEESKWVTKHSVSGVACFLKEECIVPAARGHTNVLVLVLYSWANRTAVTRQPTKFFFRSCCNHQPYKLGSSFIVIVLYSINHPFKDKVVYSSFQHALVEPNKNTSI